MASKAFISFKDLIVQKLIKAFEQEDTPEIYCSLKYSPRHVLRKN